MTGLEVDAVRVVVRSNDVQRRALLELRVEYVGGIEDACAWLSLFAPAPAVLRQLTQGQAPPDAALRPPWKLPLVDRHGASAPAVLIWRNRSLPIECGTFAVGLFRDVLGISDPTRITVRWDEAEPTVVHDRTAKVGMITRASPKGKVLGTCEKCRRDLRDPYYAAVGIGPECIKSYPAKQIQLRKRINRAVREERAVHPNAKRPAVWLSAAKSTWGLDHHGR